MKIILIYQKDILIGSPEYHVLTYAVTDADDLMIINKSGLTIRMAVEDLRVMGRATQGVKLINIKGHCSSSRTQCTSFRLAQSQNRWLNITES